MKKTAWAGVVAVAILLIAATTWANPIIIHETGYAGTEVSRGGSSISKNQFLGTSFSIDRTTNVTAIGGWMGSRTTIFGAIIPVPGPDVLPTVAPLELESIAIAYTTFRATVGHPEAAEFRTPLDVTLTRGAYALVFGSGLFGTSGLGYLGTNGVTAIPGVPTFSTDNSPPPPGFPSGRWNGPSYGNRVRMVVEGMPVPEPSALTLFVLGMASLAWVRWRRMARER